MKDNPLFIKSNNLAHLVYRLTKDFPKEEVFGITSQLRRAALSVPLNIVEGYARQSDKSFKQFLLISYGSLKETKYLIHFAFEEGLMNKNSYNETIQCAEEVGRILWTSINKVKERAKE